MATTFKGTVAPGRTLETDDETHGPGTVLSFDNEKEFDRLVTLGFVLRPRDESQDVAVIGSDAKPQVKRGPKKKADDGGKTADAAAVTPPDDSAAPPDHVD
jgi:hypothetical protein